MMLARSHALDASCPSYRMLYPLPQTSGPSRARADAIQASICVALLLFVPASLSAQTGGVLPKVTQLPASTRAMALGDSYMMNAGHADAIFYHPALLTGARGFGADVQRWGGESSSAAVSGAMQWYGGESAWA